MDNELYELVNYRYERAIETLIANFNKEYVATEIFPRSMGRRISTLALIREQSDYNDFYVASFDESKAQYEIASELIELVKAFLISGGFLRY